MSTSTSPSRLLLTPPRLTPSPRRPLFETPASSHRFASLGGKSATAKALLLLGAVASASFLAGIALRHHHAAPFETLAAATSPLPSPIPGWGDEAGSDSSEVFFHIEPFESGLNNERISLLKAAEVASRRNWTLVLPSYKDFHAVIAGEETAAGAALSPAVVLPFSHFYDERAFARHALSRGFRVVRSMPPNRFHACSKLLSLAAHWPQALTSGLLSGFAREYGVVCLSSHAVWHAIRGYDLPDLDWSANAAHAAGLRPSELYARELERMVGAFSERFGGSSSRPPLSPSAAPGSSPEFIAVHVRVEEDWRRVCAFGANRSQSHWLKGDARACLVSEAEIAESVVARERRRREESGETAPASSSSSSYSSSSSSSSSSSPPPQPEPLDSRPLAFVMSAAPTSRMPRLCDPASGALRCFSPDDVWPDPDRGALPLGRTKLVRSYVSFLFAKEKAAALFGNVHSTFSRELGDEMGARGREVVYYNPECADPGDCP